MIENALVFNEVDESDYDGASPEQKQKMDSAKSLYSFTMDVKAYWMKEVFPDAKERLLQYTSTQKRSLEKDSIPRARPSSLSKRTPAKKHKQLSSNTASHPHRKKLKTGSRCQTIADPLSHMTPSTSADTIGSKTIHHIVIGPKEVRLL